MKDVNDFEYWENIYLNNDTGWDLGGITPYIDKISDEIKKGKVIILGCGRGYDAVMLAKKGFEVTAVDFSPSAINFLNDLADQQGVSVKIAQKDIFSLTDNFKGYFDYVIEQTCFCAIDVKRRSEYELLVNKLLKAKGQLIGLWFPIGKKILDGGPPYGVSIKEIKLLFRKKWNIVKEEYSTLSVEKRKNREKIIIFKKL
jgi:methyl halide transferase